MWIKCLYCMSFDIPRYIVHTMGHRIRRACTFNRAYWAESSVIQWNAAIFGQCTFKLIHSHIESIFTVSDSVGDQWQRINPQVSRRRATFSGYWLQNRSSTFKDFHTRCSVFCGINVNMRIKCHYIHSSSSIVVTGSLPHQRAKTPVAERFFSKMVCFGRPCISVLSGQKGSFELD